MTDRKKLEKLKKLADAMYYAAQYLTTDASRLHKAMDEYHKFIINEYKEEPVSPCENCEGDGLAGTCASISELGRCPLKYRKEKEPVSEELEKAARKYAGIPEDSPHALKYCVQDKKAKYDAMLYGANWQKEQDQSTIELAEDHAMLAGMEKMKEQMMKEAVDGTVFTQLEDGEIMVRSHYFKSEKFNYLDEVKLIIIKEE